MLKSKRKVAGRWVVLVLPLHLYLCQRTKKSKRKPTAKSFLIHVRVQLCKASIPTAQAHTFPKCKVTRLTFMFIQSFGSISVSTESEINVTRRISLYQFQATPFTSASTSLQATVLRGLSSGTGCCVYELLFTESHGITRCEVHGDLEVAPEDPCPTAAPCQHQRAIVRPNDEDTRLA